MLLLSFVENEILSEDFDLSLVWKEFLGLGPHEAASETKRSYWLTQKSLYSFLSMEYREGKVIYPKQAAMFEAYRKTAPSEVKVVLLGQDPYHGPGQANGLSFSV